MSSHVTGDKTNDEKQSCFLKLLRDETRSKIVLVSKMVNRKALTFVKNVRIFADRMGKLFRENPIQIAFPEAVNLFSARSKFVHEASQKSTVRLWNVFLSGNSCVKTDDKVCVH